MLRIFIFLVTITTSYSQTLTGVISDDANKPLEYSNITAKKHYTKKLLC